jgi:hypothetical protein
VSVPAEAAAVKRAFARLGPFREVESLISAFDRPAGPNGNNIQKRMDGPRFMPT